MTTQHDLAIVEPGSPGQLLHLVRHRHASTRAELVEVTGLARSTIGQRVDQLLAEGLLVEIGEAPSTGGRPPALLGLNHDAGVVLVADLGATHSRFAVTDLAAAPLAEAAADREIADGPEQVLAWVDGIFADLLVQADRTPVDVRGVGIGVPGPVEFEAGRAVNPPIMPGWDGYDIRVRFSETYGVPVLVDNDVNIMALGEQWTMHPPVDDLMFVKVGTGIGSGLILGGRLHRGARGAAGDLGHVQVPGTDRTCTCGNVGCLEASAGGGALARVLAAQGHATHDSRDVVALVRVGNHDAVQAVRSAGRLLGSVLATTVNLLNPAVIVVGGDVADAGEQLLAGIREVVYQRSTALATNQLQIHTSSLGDRAGITGAAALVIEHVLSPEAVNAALRDAMAAS